MWNINTWIFLSFFLITGINLHAQTDSVKVKKVKGALQLGFNQSKGNVDRLSSNSSLNVNYKPGKLSLALNVHHQNFYNRGTKLDETIESSLIGIQSFGEHSRIYAKGSVYRNEFRGFALQWKEGLGYLYELEASDILEINVRLGYQLRQNEIVNDIVDEFQSGNHHFSQYGARIKVTLMKNVEGSFQIDYEQDFARGKNYYFDMLGTVSMKVNDVLNVVFKYQYWYAGIPITSRVPMDQSFVTMLAVNF